MLKWTPYRLCNESVPVDVNIFMRGFDLGEHRAPAMTREIEASAGHPRRTDLRKAFAAFMIYMIFFVSGVSFVRAQDHPGSIQGKITDNSDKALVGATAYLSSPALLGQLIETTGKSGRFDFSALPSGTYTLSVEMPGYQTLVRDGIVLNTGMSLSFNFALSLSDSEIDIPSLIPPPALDSISAKTASIIDPAYLRHLPLARDLSRVLSLAPGAVSAGFFFDDNPSLYGGTVRDNVYALDGVNMTDMFTSSPLSSLNFDLMEEIEFVSAGQSVSQIPAMGSYVNVISKSGGNSSSGELSLYFMTDGWNKDLWTPSQSQDLGLGRPAGQKDFVAPSLNLGGPIMVDRAWYFLSVRRFSESKIGTFIGPYTDLWNREHSGYDWTRKEYSAFFKLTIRPVSNARFTTWVTLGDVFQPVYEDPSPRLPFISTHVLDHETNFAINGMLNYDLSQNAQAYLRAAYVSRNTPTNLQGDALGLSWTDDAGDIYGPLSGADYNSIVKRQRIQADASLRVFADDVLGTSHTFNVGADLDDSGSNIDWWRKDNMLWYLDSRNPNTYYYPDRGLLGFWLCGIQQGSTVVEGQTARLGIFATDTFSVAKRLMFTLGLRFERSWGWFPSGSKTISGDALSVFLGDAVLSPNLLSAYPDDFSSGFNPWNAFSLGGGANVLSWNALSPRIGLAFDILGNGRTILKAGYARYTDALSHRYLMPLNPLYPQSLSFYWLDANGDGQPDQEDEYSLPNIDYRFLSSSFSQHRVADGIKAPSTDEFSISLEHELLKDFTLGLHAVSKVQSNILENVLYAPDTGEYWYSPDQAAGSLYWVPFTTTVPGAGSISSATVTFYAKSLLAPQVFLQLRNVPELKRSYRALEFSFHKRMSRGWQLSGSLILSKAEGNIGGETDETTAYTEAADSPNYFVNRYGALDTDRPLQIKLFGTVELPFGFDLSAYYHYQSGRPWQRWALILPPADWCAANNVEQTYYSVNLETPGMRREKAWSSLDLRLEKQFSLGASSKIAVYADITNLLGFTASVAGLNDIYSWAPAAEGAGKSGLTLLRSDYQVANTLYGKRTVSLGFRLTF